MLTWLQILFIAVAFWGTLAVCAGMALGCFYWIDWFCRREFERNKRITDGI